jgi:hypothetical protein
MKRKDRPEPVDADLTNEPGSIGEEQLPMDAGPKTDKHVWNYASDKSRGTFGTWLKNVFGGKSDD